MQRGGDVSLELVGDGSWLLRVLLLLMQSVIAETMFKIQCLMLQTPLGLMQIKCRFAD